MKIYYLLAIVLIAMVFLGEVNAQGLETEIRVNRRDISGKWKFNPSRSQIQYDKESADLLPWSEIMIIVQKLPAINIAIRDPAGPDKVSFGDSYTVYPDGRGDQWPEMKAGAPSISTTAWQNDKLVVTCYFNSKEAPKLAMLILEFELSADGNTLTQTVKRTDLTPGPDHKITAYVVDKWTDYLVFDRVRS